jgi:hypothetical protein
VEAAAVGPARVPDLEAWIQVVVLVVLCGFFVLGLLA